jgi:HK97 family phage portal protein
MKWLKNLFSWVPWGQRSRFPSWYRVSSATGDIRITEQTALSLMAVWAAVDYLSSVTANLSFDVYKRLPDGSKVPDPSHPCYDLVHFSPDGGETTAFRFRQTQMVHVLTGGNSFSEILRDGAGRVTRLNLLDPCRVDPQRLDNGRLIYNVDGKRRAHWEILHLAGLGWDGCRGFSPIGMARRSIGLGLSLEQSAEAFFKNASRPSGAFSAPGSLSPEKAAELRKELNEVYGGVENTGQIGLLHGGLTWQSMSISNADAEFMASREFSITEVARLFRLPPTVLQDWSRATFSNVEEANLQTVISTITPWCESIDQEYTLKLFTPEERKTWFAEHNVNSMMRGNSAARSEFYNKLFLMGAITTNQILKLENFDQLIPDAEGGNKRFVPMNLSTLDKAGVNLPAPSPPSRAIEPAPKAEPSTELKRAMRGVVVDAVGRMVRRECAALRRAAKKGDIGPEWASEYYDEHRAMIREAVAPSLAAYRAATGDNIDAETVANDMVQVSLKLVLEVSGAVEKERATEAIDQLCQTWEANRANEVADGVISD